MSISSKTPVAILSLAYVSLSLTGLVVLAVSTFTTPTPTANPNLLKQLAGSVFVAICLAGIIGGVFPSSCSHMLHFRDRKKPDERKKSGQGTIIRFEGHHPTCGSFSAHVFRLGSETYCAGCTGLVIGAIVSLFGILSYLFFDLNARERNVLVFWIGFAAVSCGLLQHQIPDGNRWIVRFFTNVAFVLGAFLLLVGVNELTGSITLEAYLLALMIYWIVARIMISQLEHRKICATCLRKCNHEK